MIRVDASISIGTGHIMRCLTLAEELRERDAHVVFSCRALDGNPQYLLKKRGFDLYEYEFPDPRKSADGLLPDWRRDVQKTQQMLNDIGGTDWLIVDHYALDARWERAVRSDVRRILVIDDLADRDHDCDLLLDQNFFLEPGRRYAGRIPRKADSLLGPRFALLRPEFAEAREQQFARDGALRRLFVSFGSFDPSNQTSRALRAIAAARLDDTAVDVVIGRDNPHRAEIKALCLNRPRCRLHIDSEDMAGLMAVADFAIGASGATNWERCCLCLPALLISIAENQYPIARDLAEYGACLFLGRDHEVTEEAIVGALRRLGTSAELVRTLGMQAGALVDGHGARRVADRLLPQPVRLRAARPADCGPMHEWRNAEETRRFAFDPAPIAFETHMQWFEQILCNPDSALLVGECATGPVGVLRYDLNRGEATVSVYLVPGSHGRGHGTSLLVAGTRWLRDQHPEIQCIIAKVKADNLASLGAFTKAGFHREHDNLVLKLGIERPA